MAYSWKLTSSPLPMLLLLFAILLITTADAGNSRKKSRRRSSSSSPRRVESDEFKHRAYFNERKHLQGKKRRNIPTYKPNSISPLPSSSSYSSLSSSSSSSSPAPNSEDSGYSPSHPSPPSPQPKFYRNRSHSQNRDKKLRRSQSSSSSSLSSSRNNFGRGATLSTKRQFPRNQERQSRDKGSKPSRKLFPRRSSKNKSRRTKANKGNSKKNRILAGSPSSSFSSLPAHGGQRPGSSSSSRGRQWQRRKPVVRSSRPNIVVILTDDQDVLLGSLQAMPKLHRLMTKQGAFFNNSFVPTPMCCPSRSGFLTGMYVHNHNTYTNNDNCSSPEWRKTHESRSFVTYINETYKTGYFGKYLNEYTGSHTPAGWQRWVGLIKNSRFYNYSVINEKGERVKHGDNYYKDYLTDLVANDSVAFLQDSKKRYPDKPVMMMLSVPAPHGPEDAAPQYQHMFDNNTLHRTPSWNNAPNPDKQWLLQHTHKMIPQHKLFTDLLQRRRLQTLQSVDDLVEKVVQQLSMLGELSNTYIIYTSDHGYHLGQYGLLKGKAMPFDFDTRVPLIMRGPGIRPGTVISNIVSNIDIAPTIIDMAGGSIPEHMDGQSMFRLIRAARDRNNVDSRGFVTTKKPWRDSILLERGKLTRGRIRMRNRMEAKVLYNQVANGGSSGLNFYIPPRTHRLAVECSKDENRLPCRPRQKWYCIEDNGRLRKHKCRHLKVGNLTPLQSDAPENGKKSCTCPTSRQSIRGRKMLRDQRKKQRRLMKKQGDRDFHSRYNRIKRSVLSRPHTVPGGGPGGNSQMPGGFSGFESMFNRRCRILSNQSVLCDLDIYQKSEAWESHKERIDGMIIEYRKALEDLRDIRQHLLSQRPVDVDMGDDDDKYDVDGDYGGGGVDGRDCDCEEDRDPGMMNFGKKRRPKPLRTLSREERRKLRRRQKQKQRKITHQHTHYCRREGMQCFTHNNDHWKTPPYWVYGPFCSCNNAANNTFWCLRTINETHDFHYCEFITTYMSFYDMHTDPFQLKNTVTDLNYGILQQLHEELKKLKQCAGGKDCTLRSGQKNRLPHDPSWPGLVQLQRATKSSSMKFKYTDVGKEEDDDDDDDEEEEEEEEDEDEYLDEEEASRYYTEDFDESLNPSNYE